MPLDPDRFRFTPGESLAHRDPSDTGPFGSEAEARASLERDAKALARAQHILNAHARYGVVVIFEGMDASGKDEAIHHVLSAIDPQASRAKHFAHMHEEEAAHDYLWRAVRSMPERGQVGVFNRSYYEHVVTDRLDRDGLDEQHLPDEIRARADDGSLWEERLRQMRDHERYLYENGFCTIKLFLHLSKDEQRRRLLERIEREEKRWDFSRADIEKRRQWDDFIDAYEHALRGSSTDYAPWYVVPADHKWYARAVVAGIVLHHLQPLHDGFPEPDAELRETLRWAKQQLKS